MAERCTYVTGGYAAKKYWNAGRAALRRSAGTMRFDLNIIASSYVIGVTCFDVLLTMISQKKRPCKKGDYEAEQAVPYGSRQL